MFNVKKAVKNALFERDMTMTRLAELTCKDRSWLTDNLYNGNPSASTLVLVSCELNYKLSEFIALGED